MVWGAELNTWSLFQTWCSSWSPLSMSWILALSSAYRLWTLRSWFSWLSWPWTRALKKTGKTLPSWTSWLSSTVGGDEDWWRRRRRRRARGSSTQDAWCFDFVWLCLCGIWVVPREGIAIRISKDEGLGATRHKSGIRLSRSIRFGRGSWVRSRSHLL